MSSQERPRRRRYRAVFLVVVLVCGGVLAVSFASAQQSGGSGGIVATHGETEAAVAPPSTGMTVVTTDSNSWLGLESDGPRANAELFAVDSAGSIVYENDSHTRYWDVDPVNGTNRTVEYVYADHLNASACGGETVCTRNGVERVNLTTGEVTPIFSRVTGGKHATRWHDVDRIDEETLVVADIANDRVFVYNTTSETVEWAWNAQAAYDPTASGGPYPDDWTHLNDVEVLPDGRIMVSLRNHDQVVFLDRETGRVDDWTLGADGDHETLYEQHNPDYLPAERGGPSVIAADSESNRVVEYRRVDDSWEQTWVWTDEQLAWPRDADRLPNGNTLVTDSNGNRVLEVAPNGSVVWSIPVAFPYEAERLGTGDESAGGQAVAQDGGMTSTAAGETEAGEEGTQDDGPWGPLSGTPVNAVLYVLPVWMGPPELAAVVALAGALAVWGVFEYRWSRTTFSLSSPVAVERGDSGPEEGE